MPPETVIVRYVCGGRVWAALPTLLVAEREGLLVLWLAPGSVGQEPKSAGRERGVPAGDWWTAPKRWAGPGPLILVRPQDAHAIWLFWNDDGDFAGWYVNLQEPLRRSRFGYDSMDQALDVVVRPDGSWEWKDEDELAEQVELGVWSAEEAIAVRQEAERVLAAWPFPTGWEDFQPDPSWPVPELPEDWHVV